MIDGGIESDADEPTGAVTVAVGQRRIVFELYIASNDSSIRRSDEIRNDLGRLYRAERDTGADALPSRRQRDTNDVTQLILGEMADTNNGNAGLSAFLNPEIFRMVEPVGREFR